MTTIRLTQRGFQTIPTSGIIVFLDGSKPLCGNLNIHPKSMGGGTYWHFYRGNAAGAQPFVFADMGKAQEAIAKIGATRARFYIGNNWIAEMKGGETTVFEKPIKQLL